jgi:hypothetical protein
MGSASIVVVAVEVGGNGSGRLRMRALDDLWADSLCGFVVENVAPGSIVRTDAWQVYMRLGRIGYDHPPMSQRAAALAGLDDAEAVPRAHRIVSNLKTRLRGTYRGVSEAQLQGYLDEFVFRFDRRRTPMAAFQTLLGIGVHRLPTTYDEIPRRGRAC